MGALQFPHVDHHLAFVVAARTADAVRELGLTAASADREVWRCQILMRASIAAPVSGQFSLWIGHENSEKGINAYAKGKSLVKGYWVCKRKGRSGPQ